MLDRYQTADLLRLGFFETVWIRQRMRSVPRDNIGRPYPGFNLWVKEVSSYW